MWQFQKEHAVGFHTVEPERIWDEYINDYFKMDKYYRRFHTYSDRVMKNQSEILSDLYKEEKYDEIDSYINDKKIEINYRNDSDFLVINISKDINITSPILNIIFGRTYKLDIEKSIYKNE